MVSNSALPLHTASMSSWVSHRPFHVSTTDFWRRISSWTAAAVLGMALSMRMRVYSMAKRRHTDMGADSWMPCATGNRSSTTSRASETGSTSARMLSAQRRSPTPVLPR